jgi:hypothetical protein
MIVEDILPQRKNLNAMCGLLSKSQQYMIFKVIFVTENLGPFEQISIILKCFKHVIFEVILRQKMDSNAIWGLFSKFQSIL